MTGLCETLRKAAAILEREAEGIEVAHTILGRWVKGPETATAHRDYLEMRLVAKNLRKAAVYMASSPLGGPAKVFDAIADEIRCGTSPDAAMRLYGVRFEDGAPR